MGITTDQSTEVRLGQRTATVEIQPTWLSYRDAERLTGLSRVTLWRHISASNEIKVARVGRAVRINRQSLEDYLDRQAEQG